MDDREKSFDEEFLDALSRMLGGIEGIMEEEGKKEGEGTKDSARFPKHSGHIFADAEIEGKWAEVEYFKEVIIQFIAEREKLREEAEKSMREVVLFEKMYNEALKDLTDASTDYDQLSMRYEEATRLLAASEEEQSQEKADQEELGWLEKQVEDQLKLNENLRAAVRTVQVERDQFRACVNAIRVGLGSIPKDPVKGKLEKFVSCTKEAISKIST